MKIISNTVKKCITTTEEIIVDYSGSMVLFRDTLAEMKQNGYVHDFVVIDDLRYERFTKVTEEEIK